MNSADGQKNTVSSLCVYFIRLSERCRQRKECRIRRLRARRLCKKESVKDKIGPESLNSCLVSI